MRTGGCWSQRRLAIGGLAVLLGLVVAAPLGAQEVPSDVPQSDWAYQEVRAVANKGLVKGYPNGRFLGNRALTRYESATSSERRLQAVNDKGKAAAPPPPPPPPAPPPPPPPPPSVTPED